MCPGCGSDVKVGSQGCPKCNNLDPWEIEGNDSYDGLSLPDEDDLPLKNLGKSLLWWVTAVLLLLAMFFAFVL